MSDKDKRQPGTYDSTLHKDEKRAAVDSAVALRYSGHGAPRVTAKGEGELAQRILEIAEKNGVPLHEDAALMQMLAQIEIGEEIPSSLYVAVAEVIAFAYMLSGKTPQSVESTQ